MFEDCKTLAELNQARAQAVTQHPIVEVNNAYNVQRQKILKARKTYVECTFKKVPVYEQVPTAVLVYKGVSSKAGVIEIRTDGVYA